MATGLTINPDTNHGTQRAPKIPVLIARRPEQPV